MAEDILILEDDNQEGAIMKDESNSNIIENDDGSKVMSLKYPVTVKTKVSGGSEQEHVTNELRFRRPNGSDMRAVEKIANEQERGIKMFIRVAGINEVIFDKLDLEDINAGMEVVAGFLPMSQKTGPTS